MVDGPFGPSEVPPGDPVSGGRAYGEIIAVGVRPAGGGPIALQSRPKPGEPVLRWASRSRTIPGIEAELARIWAVPDLMSMVDGEPGRHIAARTSVMNLVVVARRPEIGERCAATINQLVGRHPSRTLIVLSADPDGPSWIDARIEAHCVMPREDAPETCAERIFLTAGGETGRHLGAIVAPLLVHDLPVTIWWPGEPPFGTPQSDDVLAMGDRLVVDGSTWSGDGLERLRHLAELYDRFPRLSIRDFALVRQSRWREAIASVFDMPMFVPYLLGIRRIAVSYAVHDAVGVNIVKPLYHVAWLGSRLGMRVAKALAPITARGPAIPRNVRSASPQLDPGLGATLKDGQREVAVVVKPSLSELPSGTTLRVELLAERRGSELRADVTAEKDKVRVRVWVDGIDALERTFNAPRRSDTDLLGEAIEIGGRDPLARETTRMAAALVGGARVRG
jgi:hypothetical protein